MTLILIQGRLLAMCVNDNILSVLVIELYVEANTEQGNTRLVGKANYKMLPDDPPNLESHWARKILNHIGLEKREERRRKRYKLTLTKINPETRRKVRD